MLRHLKPQIGNLAAFPSPWSVEETVWPQEQIIGIEYQSIRDHL